jgi:hypothetical protein
MIFLLGILALAVLASSLLVVLWARVSNESKSEGMLIERPGRGLFDEPPEVLALSKPKADASAQILERAARGDLTALNDATREQNRGFYSKALDALVGSCNEADGLSRIVSHITTSGELRPTVMLAERIIDAFKASPSLRLAADMLHVAALSDDAAVYQRAVDELLAAWQSGQLSQLSAEKLQKLIESQYWALAPEARLGGAGLVLKRRLAEIRR